jgi:heat shock protein HslJ
LLSVNACAASNSVGAHESRLEGKDWVFESVETGASSWPLPESIPAGVRFDDKTHFSAYGCNFVSGRVVIHGHRIHFRGGMSTAIGCAGLSERVDSETGRVLYGSVWWEVTPDGTLVMRRGDVTARLHLRPTVFPATSAPVVSSSENPDGPQWQLTYDTNGWLEWVGRDELARPWKWAHFRSDPYDTVQVQLVSLGRGGFVFGRLPDATVAARLETGGKAQILDLKTFAGVRPFIGQRVAARSGQVVAVDAGGRELARSPFLRSCDLDRARMGACTDVARS